jgi:2-oxoglutarate ferredoxin oxidoreductase subunit gamma
LGNVRIANMVLLGAFAELTGLISLDTLMEQLDEHLSERQRKWLEPNRRALVKGAELAAEGC